MKIEYIEDCVAPARLASAFLMRYVVQTVLGQEECEDYISMKRARKRKRMERYVIQNPRALDHVAHARNSKHARAMNSCKTCSSSSFAATLSMLSGFSPSVIPKRWWMHASFLRNDEAMQSIKNTRHDV